MNVKDKELIQGCIAGDKVFWDEFVNQFSNLIYDSILRTLRKYGHPIHSDVLDDIFQDFFVTILKNQCKALRDFEGLNGCTLASYLKHIAGKKTVDYLRKLRPIFSIDQVDHNGEQSRKFIKELTVYNTQIEIKKHEVRQKLRCLLVDLKEAEQCFVKMLTDQKTAQEISDELGISLANVYTKTYRIIKKMQSIAIKKKIV